MVDNAADLEECPLCKNPVPIRVFFPENDSRFALFKCERCGEFGADKQCILSMRKRRPDPSLSGVARQMPEAGETLGSPTPTSARRVSLLPRASLTRPADRSGKYRINADLVFNNDLTLSVGEHQ